VARDSNPVRPLGWPRSEEFSGSGLPECKGPSVDAISCNAGVFARPYVMRTRGESPRVVASPAVRCGVACPRRSLPLVHRHAYPHSLVSERGGACCPASVGPLTPAGVNRASPAPSQCPSAAPDSEVLCWTRPYMGRVGSTGTRVEPGVQ